MFLGIDLGSRDVKIAVLDTDNFKKYKYETISFYRNYGRKVDGKLRIDFTALGLKDIDAVVSTGYGRLTVEVEGGKVIPEIKAHAEGAIFQTALLDFTLLDIGGQDSKVILVREGKVRDFATNDKCAAGSGRYLENMAKIIGVELDELAKYTLDPTPLSTTCAIFGESELIGQIIEGVPIANLAAGINYSVFKRIQPMLQNLLTDKIVFTGGGAYNTALAKIIAVETEVEVIIPAEPQFNGAIGCAILAKKMYKAG
jgi:predicted CoA-substrate-specific enzyme activase